MSTFRELADTIRAAVPSWVPRYNRKYQNEAVRRMNVLLQQASLTQRDLAARTGWKPAYVSRILSGSENLTLRTVARFEDAVGADVLTVTGEDARPKATGVAVQTSTLRVSSPARPGAGSFVWTREAGQRVEAGRDGLAVEHFAPVMNTN